MIPDMLLYLDANSTFSELLQSQFRMCIEGKRNLYSLPCMLRLYFASLSSQPLFHDMSTDAISNFKKLSK